MSQIHEYYSLKMQENRLPEHGNWEVGYSFEPVIRINLNTSIE